MTIEVVFFDTMEQAKVVKQQKSGTWRALHNDFVDGKIRVTFVNGVDDPINSQETQDRKIFFNRTQELILKLQDDSMTFSEWKEYFRLMNEMEGIL